MISPPRISVLIEQYIPGKYATSLKYLQLHTSMIVIGREEGRYDATLPYAKNTINLERREGRTPLLP
jgi:predicted  nucleic acid-binding Zn-ribbon protein